MKPITIIFIFIYLYSCGQNKEKKLTEKNIYQVVKDMHITSLNTLKLNGNIKIVIEEYKKTNTKDTVINFSKYELTKSDIEKEPWFISPNITNYYKAKFNQQGFLVESLGVYFKKKDSIFANFIYDKNNRLITENNIEKEASFQDVRTWENKVKYIYNEQNHLTKILSEEGDIIYKYQYQPEKMQLKEISISYETDSLETDVITYNKYGLELSRQHYNSKNEKGDLWISEFDRFGNLIKEKFKGKDGNTSEYKSRKIDTSVKIYRLYDEKKNCIERIIQHKNGRLDIRKLKIEYY